jgi:hypothetical protein
MDSSVHINKYKIDKNSYYLRIKGSIVGSKLVHLGAFRSDYAEYHLKIETNYANWTLIKKYDDFYKLHTKLIVIIPELKKLFPPKRIFMSTDNIIGERIKSFNNYFNYLFNNINIFLIDEVIKFISLSKELILLFIKKYILLKVEDNDNILISMKDAYSKAEQDIDKNRKDSNDIISILEDNSNYYDSILNYETKRQISFSWNEPPSVTPYLLVIKEFLYNLSEKSENKAEILESFQNFIKKDTKFIKLTSNEIKYLYLGEEEDNKRDYLNRTDFFTQRKKKISSDFKYHTSSEFFDLNDEDKVGKDCEEDDSQDIKIKGLFYIIGNSNKNIILIIGALDLLNKLIDTEYNPDAELYIKIFKGCKIQHYKMLNLNNIIKLKIGGNNTILNAMKLLQLIFYDKTRDEYKQIIFEDKAVYKQYINYINKFIE